MGGSSEFSRILPTTQVLVISVDQIIIWNTFPKAFHLIKASRSGGIKIYFRETTLYKQGKFYNVRDGTLHSVLQAPNSYSGDSPWMLAALSPVAGVLAVAAVKRAQVYVSFRQILRACEGPHAPEPFKIACMS